MAAIKTTCMVMLLAVWTVVLFSSCCASEELMGGWREQNPYGDPTYLKLAHYAVSRQTKGKRVFDTVVKLRRVATQVVNGFKYMLLFAVAPSNCKIGRDYYSARRCRPTRQPNKECQAIVYIAPTSGRKRVVRYNCRVAVRA
ncbi:hypothetical protein MTO96_039960 [Rhipicephalus appendiculatus]